MKSSIYQPVRGTHDRLTQACDHANWIVACGTLVAKRGNFHEISPPLLEHKKVFTRSAGALSDVVAKEMYELRRRDTESESESEDDVVLRPEATASVIRALLHQRKAGPSHPWSGVAKHYYHGPMFRYDRPQKGRLRQFHQVGLETFGQLSSPGHILDSLMCALDFLEALDLTKQVKVEINTLGTAANRKMYAHALRAYLSGQSLSATSLKRLDDNPLRILDSKDPLDQEACAQAPVLRNFIDPHHHQNFQAIVDFLKPLPLTVRDNPRLVRGLDYYTGFVFEITAASLGAQKTILAGGQYDGLSALLGGPEAQGMGWAAGIERLMLLTNPPPSTSSCIGVLAQSPDLIPNMWNLIFQLRKEGYTADSFLGSLDKISLGAQLSLAHKAGCPRVVIVAEDEFATNQVIIKDMHQGTQIHVSLDQLKTALATYREPFHNE